MSRVSRDVDLEQALRQAHLATEKAHAEGLYHLAFGRAVMDELQRWLAERADVDEGEMQARIAAGTAQHFESLEQSDATSERRLQLSDVGDKYKIATDGGPPCSELLPICGARCCTFDLPLSTQDLDEGVIAWDRERPYLIRHDEHGRCVHFERGRGCTVYAQRPAVCRVYDCRRDPRIWADYEARVMAPVGVEDPLEWRTSDLVGRLERRREALAAEAVACGAVGSHEGDP